ncbi:hypothetical protein IIA16_06580, partial [bacterium]|nr:hypothetical protein [bacterium]
MILVAIANPFTWDGLAVWLAAGLTLFIFSFLFKDNPFYRFAEHLFVGLGAGYVVVVAYWNDIATNVFAPMQNGLAAVACHRGTAGPDVPCESLMEAYPQIADGWSDFLNPIAAVILGMFLFFPVVAPRLRYLTR